jgi:hypothetical protein
MVTTHTKVLTEDDPAHLLFGAGRAGSKIPRDDGHKMSGMQGSTDKDGSRFKNK